jgi:hypothetical protein
MTAEEKLAEISRRIYGVGGVLASEIASIIARPDTVAPPRRPGDVLAEKVERAMNSVFWGDNRMHGEAYPHQILREALDEYRSTKANEPNPEEIRTAGLLDQKKLARLLLDSLTGGALSGMLAILHDHKSDLRDGFGSASPDLENLQSALHMLGVDP